MEWGLQKARSFWVWWRGLSYFGQKLPLVLVSALFVVLLLYIFSEISETECEAVGVNHEGDLVTMECEHGSVSLIDAIVSDGVRNLGLLLAASIGWFFFYWRAKIADQSKKAAEKSAETAGKGLITERLTRATEQLASDKSSVRLGGIRGLEQIFRTHEEERDKIVRILVAFVHDFAPISSDTRTIQMRGKHSDIAEAIEVLAEITECFPSVRKTHLDLHDTNLSGLIFIGTNLSNFKFFGANFSNSSFWHVDFTDAILGMVNFSGTIIHDPKGLTRKQVREAFYWDDNPPEEFPVEFELEERESDEEKKR